MLRITVGCRGGRGLAFAREEGYGFARGGDGGTNGGLAADGENGGGASGIADDATGSPLIVAGGGGGMGGRGLFYTAPGGGHAPDLDGAVGGPDGVGVAGEGGGSSIPAGGKGGDAETASSGGGGGGGGGGYPHGGGGGGGGGLGGTAGGGGGGGNSYLGPDIVFGNRTTADEREDGEVTIGYVGPAGAPQIFECTGSAANYTVPAGASALSIVAVGAAGGNGRRTLAVQGDGGRGGVAHTELDVSPGTVYRVAAGCKGGQGADSGLFDDGPGGGGGFGIIRGGRGGEGSADALPASGGGGGGGGGASGLATQYPLTAGSLRLAVSGGGGGGSAGRYTDGGDGGDFDAVGEAGDLSNGGARGGLGALGGSEVGAVGGNGGDAGTLTSGGGGGGGGGGLQGGGGGTAGAYLGGGGGGGAGGHSFVASAMRTRSTSGWQHLGTGDGVVIITPIWGKLPTTTTVTVPVGAVYDGNPKTATAQTVDGEGNVLANPAVTYQPGPGAPVNAGTYTASASYLGDDTYAGSSDSKTFTVFRAASNTEVTVANATYDGNPHGGTAKVTGAGGLNQALTVTYAGRNGTVYAASTTAPTNAGDYTASAVFAGDANHSGTSESRDYSIAKAGIGEQGHRGRRDL